MTSNPVASTSKLPPMGNPVSGEDEEGEDDERLDLAALQGFADKIQRRPLEDDVDGEESRVKIVIPKRGEKDFEPLAETVNLQEMMLQRSREALFGALAGVRGGNSKAVSHAILTPDSIYPKMLVVRGRLLDTMGISVRYNDTPTGRPRTYIELLPEEALYLLERGTLQIWLGRLATSKEEAESGVGEYCEEEYGVKGAVEMSVMEGYAAFMGAEGLTWERYQAYAYLKRLGYTVQRSRQFIPAHFTFRESIVKASERPHHSMAPFRSWWFSLPSWLARLSRALVGRIAHMTSAIAGAGIRAVPWNGRMILPTTLASPSRKWSSYGRIMASLRITPTTHAQPVPTLPAVPSEASIYSPLDPNPYIPFWHVWKPATHWSKVNWDRGAPSSFVNQKPEYIIAVINARDTPMPSLAQLSQVFDSLPDEPKGPVKKLGPQYQRPTRPGPNRTTPADSNRSVWNPARWFAKSSSDQPQNNGNPMAALRNGDRGLIVAVNDSGNTGWVRFGRTGFADHVVI